MLTLDTTDLLVGAYSSNAAVLLRARPIIQVSTELESSQLESVDPGRAGCPLDPQSAHTCFHFQACFTVRSALPPGGMEIRFRILAEPGKAVSRVWLRLAETAEADSRSSQVEHRLSITEAGRPQCTAILGYLSDSQADLQTPVRLDLSYSLVQGEPTVSYDRGAPLPSVDLFPILDQQQARRTFYAKFQKNCGADEVCQAQLRVRPRLFDRELELRRSSQGGAYELELGTFNELSLEVRKAEKQIRNILVVHEVIVNDQSSPQVEVENLGEAAYEAKLDISFPSVLSYVGLGVGSQVNAPNLVNSSYLSFDLGNPFKGASEKSANKAKIRLRFSPASLINQTLIRFDFLANTTSELVVDSSTFLHCVLVKRAELAISGRGSPEKVWYGGEVRGESAMRDLAEVGPLVDHRYLVKNYGPAQVDVLTGKQRLYCFLEFYFYLVSTISGRYHV